MKLDANPTNILERFLKVSTEYLHVEHTHKNSSKKDRRTQQLRRNSRMFTGIRKTDF